MEQQYRTYDFDLAGRKLTLEFGKMAKQAQGSVLVRYGDTAILSAVTVSKEAKPIDFFPLTVNYEERLYAVGKIPGGFIKREGRPSEKAILASRLIDRPIRPLFPEGFRNEVQVVNTVLSVDQDCSPEIAAMIGTSAALCVSEIPFNGPIAGVIVGRVDGQFVINPTVEQMEKSDIHLVVAGTRDAINMVEAGADQVPEEVMLEAIMTGHEVIKELVAFQDQIVAEIGKEKMEVVLHEVDPEIDQAVRSYAEARLKEAIRIEEKQARYDAIDAIKEETRQHFAELNPETYPEQEAMINEVLHNIVKEEVRRLITEEKIRPDGRALNEIRPLSSEVGLLPRTHGSGLFTRGQTQALSVCTLGALGDVQILDGLGLEESKRFMHHYNFPPYSVGEARPLRAPGRREIGHGALGERAIEPIIPSESEFPYTIRLVSEVIESNGSTSQASICASVLALMDAGVPIKAPVAGIAMGLIMGNDGKTFSILTDIQGMEDHLGDMDFKVAGTEKGVTAIQMDIKISGINREILQQALEQAREGRLVILKHMMETISAPRPQLSPYAPKIITMQINPDKIREVIGPQGRVINKIIDETGVKIDIEQDGRIYIASVDQEANLRAKQIIEDLVREVTVGQTYLGTVKRVEKYGAFIELFAGKEGLCHISQLAEERVAKTEDVVSIGDKVLVKVTEIDDQGRINLSRKAVLKEQAAQRAAAKAE
ncbi:MULTISPECIES: polyribonucleotide nucleotidyltransferase [Brevibacillus]|jgi:polyribonucleotide nucleotidyltransferase|uniref:Polyribonucleotide nucleotidyltransferase n=1 Tax=Brevibacillus aydinogluensis TaxID=927786 RepID=A0AA48RHD7_9BACL|nr:MULTISPECIES: polyribonucleotide nucleotidyltransferase [Bacillales]REK64163.1 MAG: polyribonucleotide nucleotidyltransferase [Brevibacillus sp.]MBR8659442.1 polyribonucleotide nucleotidyltransferase [Brevibacillus sp. NL20B1]MDT3414972.1 polyribonucleotide nucleotidyltransferase [Brevibacillus aydinogluensis]UFJ60784.1 polyribonucleotide nucleotidyltransferase [Anoxybacillus sediminis]CAJ1002486.1 polyribonucleotide nucleotidyltransferase [Brevibacillus aydinogluensis]